LKFAILRLFELHALKFEYLTNPFYQDHHNEPILPLNDIEAKLEALQNELIEVDGKSHDLYYKKLFNSF